MAEGKVMTQFTEAKVGNLSLLQIAALFVTFLGVISVLCSWSYFYYSSVSGVELADISGWDFAFSGSLAGDVITTEAVQRYAPFLAWLFALAAFVATFMSIPRKNGAAKLDLDGTSKIWIVCGILMIVLTCVWGFWESKTYPFEMFRFASTGCWLMIFSGITTLICGLIPKIKIPTED
jgi:hypothetical protein